MAETGSKQSKRFLCGHCDTNLSKTAFYQHRRLYFDTRLNKWSKTRVFRPRDDLNEPSFSVSIEDFADEPSCSSSADELQFSLQKDEDCNTEGEGEKL